MMLRKLYKIMILIEKYFSYSLSLVSSLKQNIKSLLIKLKFKIKLMRQFAIILTTILLTHLIIADQILTI